MTKVVAAATSFGEEVATRILVAQNTFTEAETIAIWDKISATLRLRPGAF